MQKFESKSVDSGICGFLYQNCEEKPFVARDLNSIQRAFVIDCCGDGLRTNGQFRSRVLSQHTALEVTHAAVIMGPASGHDTVSHNRKMHSMDYFKKSSRAWRSRELWRPSSFSPRIMHAMHATVGPSAHCAVVTLCSLRSFFLLVRRAVEAEGERTFRRAVRTG